MAEPARNLPLNAAFTAYLAAFGTAYLTAFGKLPPAAIFTAFYIGIGGAVLVLAGLALNVYRARPGR